jgi:hypothetical protein
LTGKESREECVTNWLQKQEIRSAGWSKDSSLATCGYREPVAIPENGRKLTVDTGLAAGLRN